MPSNQKQGEFDTEKYYLGKLCKRGHDWNGTNRSLRLKYNGQCIECKRYFNSMPRITEDRKIKQRVYSTRYNKKNKSRVRKYRKEYYLHCKHYLTDVYVSKLIIGQTKNKLCTKDIPKDLLKSQTLLSILKRCHNIFTKSINNQLSKQEAMERMCQLEKLMEHCNLLKL